MIWDTSFPIRRYAILQRRFSLCLQTSLCFHQHCWHSASLHLKPPANTHLNMFQTLSCIGLFLQTQWGSTYSTFPAACSLLLRTVTPPGTTHNQQCANLQPATPWCLPTCLLPPGMEGSSPLPQGVQISSSHRADNPPWPHGACLSSSGSGSCRQFVSTLGAFCNSTLLVFLHNSIPLEPHNILLIALGLETFFASEAAAMDLSFARSCWCSCFRNRSFWILVSRGTFPHLSKLSSSPVVTATITEACCFV